LETISRLAFGFRNHPNPGTVAFFLSGHGS
jgi:hypothetical protein